MTDLAMLLVCLIAGTPHRAAHRMPDHARMAPDGFVIHVALPTAILEQIRGLWPSVDLMWPVLLPWVLLTPGAALFAVTGRLLRWPDRTTGALIVTAGLANTSFVGQPLNETFHGTRDLSTGILIDQRGTYLALGTAGITVASDCGSISGAAIRYRSAWALVSSGCWGRRWWHRRMSGCRGDMARVAMFEAAMGPRIGGAIAAMQYRLHPLPITLMVGIGSALSFLPRPIW